MNEPLVITKKYSEEEFELYIITDEHIICNNNSFPVKALWDTGSSESVISSEIAKKLNLKRVGKAKVDSTGSNFQSQVYEMDLLLGEKQIFWLNVTESSELNKAGLDVLLGMDVISLGDFAISAYNESIYFSFRYPPQGLIDFTK